MRIALIMERIETWRGGAETSTVQFAAHLSRLGCDVTILTASQAQSTPAYTVVPIHAPSTLRSSRTAVFVKRAAEYIKANPFDIVHSITPCAIADVYQPRGGTIPETLERNRAIRSGTLRRGLKQLGQSLNLKYRVVAREERRLLTRRPAPWVIAISRYVSEQLVRHYQVDPSRIRLIFNGVDPDDTPPERRRDDRHQIRKQFKLAEDDLVALCVAHNFKLKGVGKLIEAAAIARQGAGTNPGPARTDLYTIVVGRDDPAPYVRLAERLGVADRVFFAGATQRTPAFFHAADFLVHPTFYDPCSRVVLEALAAGVPVITTRYNGAAEVIADGREGYVIDSPLDVEALADRMTRLADADHRRDCALRAPEAVAPYSMARHASEVRRLYDDMLTARAGNVARPSCGDHSGG